MKRSELLGKIEETDDVHSWDFTQQIRKIILSADGSLGSVSEVSGLLVELIEDESLAKELRLKAFVGFLHLHRRNKNLPELEAGLAKYQQFFGEEPLFSYYQNDYVRNKNLLQREAALTASQKLYEVHKNPAFGNAYCMVVSEFLDSEFEMPERDNHVGRAKRILMEIVAQKPSYANFYFTKGCLYAALGEYAAAREAVEEAIAKENADRQDYALRILNYTRKQVEIESRSEGDLRLREMQAHYERSASSLAAIQEGLDTKVAQIEKKVDHAESLSKGNVVRNIEILGFFVAAVSFFAASIKISGAYPAGQATQMIFVVLGAIMMLFSTLGIIARGWGAIRESALQFGAAILVLVFAFFVTPGLTGGEKEKQFPPSAVPVSPEKDNAAE